ncbi:histidine kinase [Luteolibacter soli]|uniref:Oxygen sensor histidine kinase NreB n=1 Tax=Luteolibacter soli TaxID=3135280 RepID=A0ABU9AZK3_9BACT
MKWIHLLSATAMLAALLLPCRGEEVRELGTVAEVRALREATFNTEHPLSLTGVVTWVHPGRNLLVVQDDTGAVGIHPDSPGIPVKLGQRVSLKAAGSSPFVANCPGFPFAPSGKGVLDRFEIPANEGEYRLTRMRGWLRPPVTGDYTFWIASDDSSELWLSENQNPGSVKRVAFVPPGQWTLPREWLRFPSQRSERIHLRAGERYYIEAYQEQALAGSHLAVAWEISGGQPEVIEGNDLIPWKAEQEESASGTGILREFWTNYSVAKVGPLTSGSMSEGELSVRGLEMAVLGEGAWPAAKPIDPAADLQADDSFRWVSGEGVIYFAASDGEAATLEIASGARRFLLRVASWSGGLPAVGKRARFRGVCEAGRDSGGRLIVSSIWTPSESEVSISEAAPESAPSSVDVTAPASTESVMGGGYFTRGVVTFSDEVLGKQCLVVQETLGGIFVSQDERKPHPPLFVGHSVEIGGNLRQRRFSPAILPLSLNILGWLNLPTPAKPANESDYRDGLWSELEGVVRRVNADGTMELVGKQSAIRVWLGHTDRGALESLVDSALCVRGVMSLETFEVPMLLVPSRDFLEIRDAAPTLPVKPTPIGGLGDAAAKDGWLHRTRVEGSVTYQRDGFFFIQDDTGAVRVLANDASPLKLGSVVSVTGFPERKGSGVCMSAASWTLLPDSRPVAAASLNARQADQSRHGELVKLQAHLFSQAHRGDDLMLELQEDGQVFEVVVAGGTSAVPVFEPGSLLEVTGIGLLMPSPGSSSRLQILARGSQDLVLLKGPPWWTWQRTMALVGVLLVVLAGALMRIFFLNRRFARQQAARLAFTRAMLESQESERRRIAASLHDSLGQELLVIRNQAHLALQSAPEALRQRLEEISDTTLQAINEVREITRNLRPYQLDRLGLTQSIRALTRKVSENCSVEFASHVNEIDGLFDNDSEIHIYRIVQEGIHNVLKHSGATEAAVVVKANAAGLSISIRDNGRGFSDNGSAPDSGFGLSGIKERAEIMGGSARMDSAPGQGVNLQVLVPLPTTCATASKS